MHTVLLFLIETFKKMGRMLFLYLTLAFRGQLTVLRYTYVNMEATFSNGGQVKYSEGVIFLYY